MKELKDAGIVGFKKKRTVILTVVSIIGVGLAVTFFTLAKIEKEKRIKTQQRLSITIQAKKAVESALERMAETKEDFKNRWKKEKRNSQILAQKLKNEKRRRQRVLNELEKVRDQLTEERWRTSALEQKVEEIKTKYDKLRSGSTKTVELGKIMVTAETTLQGKVVSVNQEYEFIVVDLGKKDGLEIGALLGIYRKNNLIGKARVEEVRKGISAATILHELKWYDITSQDKVKKL